MKKKTKKKFIKKLLITMPIVLIIFTLIKVNINGVDSKYDDNIKTSSVSINTNQKKVKTDVINYVNIASKNKTPNKSIVTTVPNQAKKKITAGNIRKINPNKPMVALTFDDGPHPKYTVEILDELKKYNGRATFFVLGNRAASYKGVVKRIVKDGNQIGNHTYSHKQLTKLNITSIKSEVVKSNNIIQNISAINPSIIRAPYGSINRNVKANVSLPIVLWSIDTLDWKTRNEKLVVKSIKNVKSGDIILMHDIYKTTAAAAKEIIKDLSAKGYQLVTIDELYTAKGKKLEKGKVYYNAYK